MSTVADRIRNLSKEELLKMYEVEFEDYTEEALKIAEEEIKARGVALEKYYYNDLMGEKGPVSKRCLIQMIKNGDLEQEHLVKHEKDEKWSFIKDVDFTKKYLHTKKEETSKKYNNIENDERRTYVKVASILFIVESGIWSLITLLQLVYYLGTGDTDFLLTISWNIVMVVIGVVVGTSMLKLKKWTYNWGQGTSILGMIWYGADWYMNGLGLSIVFFIMSIVIFLLLMKKEDLFIEE